MKDLKDFTREQLKVNPRQVQVFTPSPSTYSALMYWTGRDPFSGEQIYVERSYKGRKRQKSLLVFDSAKRKTSHSSKAGRNRSAGPISD